MKICIQCKKEMTCVFNGTKVRYSYDGSHVYPGDRFKCPECGNEIVVCNTTPVHDDNPVITNDDVLMEPIVLKKTSINLRRTKEEPQEKPKEKIPRNRKRQIYNTSDMERLVKDDEDDPLETIKKMLGKWVEYTSSTGPR